MKTLNRVQKLQVIEDETFEMGEKALKAFIKSGSVSTLRGAVVAYRCSMQAMRDNIRFTVVSSNNKK